MDIAMTDAEQHPTSPIITLVHGGTDNHTISVPRAHVAPCPKLLRYFDELGEDEAGRKGWFRGSADAMDCLANFLAEGGYETPDAETDEEHAESKFDIVAAKTHIELYRFGNLYDIKDLPELAALHFVALLGTKNFTFEEMWLMIKEVLEMPKSVAGDFLDHVLRSNGVIRQDMTGKFITRLDAAIDCVGLRSWRG